MKTNICNPSPQQNKGEINNLSRNWRKHLMKFLQPRMIRSLSKLGIERVSNIDNEHSNYICNKYSYWWNIKCCSLRMRIWQKYLLSPPLFDIVLEVLASHIKQEKRNKRNKYSGRLFLFTNDMTEKPECIKKQRNKQLELMFQDASK